MGQVLMQLLEKHNITGADAQTCIQSARRHYWDLQIDQRTELLHRLFGSDGIRAGAVLLEEALS